MTDQIYSNVLLGMTISQAELFIHDNTIYFNKDNPVHITSVADRQPDKFYFDAYVPGMVNVKTQNGIISEILYVD